MKKFLLSLCLLLISVSLFAEIRSTTKELKKGIHYSVDSSVNIRKEASLSSDKIGKVNLGDKIEVLEKTDVYFESEGIYDCFYKIKCNAGTGYMFGGYISDNDDNLIFESKEYVYFDKCYDCTINIPKKISSKFFYNLSDDNKSVLRPYFMYDEDSDFYNYTEYAGEAPSLEKLLEIEKILRKVKGEIFERKFSKASLYAKNSSAIKKTELIYDKISEISILKNQFSNTSFLLLKIIEYSDMGYVDAIDFITFQNGEFKLKRRCATSAQDGIYSSTNTFIFPNDEGGEKNTIRIKGKYLQGTKVTEEYDVKAIWDGKNFIDK